MRINRFYNSYQPKRKRRRHNLATANETLAAVYVKIVNAIIKDFMFLTLVDDSGTPNTFFPIFLMQLSIVCDCIIIPAYWLYSTYNDWEEFWSNEISQRHIKNWNASTEIKPLEPRGPYIGDINLNLSENIIWIRKGRFCYL